MASPAGAPPGGGTGAPGRSALDPSMAALSAPERRRLALAKLGALFRGGGDGGGGGGGGGGRGSAGGKAEAGILREVCGVTRDANSLITAQPIATNSLNRMKKIIRKRGGNRK